MGGYELSSILGRGLTYAYSWIRKNIALRPINEYPTSNVDVLIKMPNGELVQGGVLCVVPVVPVSPWVLTRYEYIPNTTPTTSFPPISLCTRVNNGVVYLSGLLSMPIFYIIRVR